MITRSRLGLATILVVLIALVCGCTPHYKITHDLVEFVNLSNGVFVRPFVDGLPNDIDPDDRPSAEALEKFRSHVIDALSERLMVHQEHAPAYYVEGTILSYKKGSGFVRFMFGMGLGSAKVTVELKLMDSATDEELFAGNFQQTISSGFETGDDMYKRVAKDFARALDQRLSELQ